MALVDGPRGFAHFQSDKQNCGTCDSWRAQSMGSQRVGHDRARTYERLLYKGQTLEYLAEEHHPMFQWSYFRGLETSNEWYFLLEYTAFCA